MNLSQFLLTLYARKPIVLLTWLTVIILTAAISLLLPKEYTAATDLVVDFKATNPVTGMMLPSQLLPTSYLATQMDIVNSRNVALKVIRNLRMIEDSPSIQQQFQKATGGKGTIQDWLADTLLSKLEVKPSRESSIITLSYSGADPQFAALLANGFAQAYIQTNQELKVEPAKQTAQWFDQQLNQLRGNLEQAQQRLSDYQRAKGVVLSDERIDVETARLGDLSNQMVAAQSSAFDASSRQKQHEASPEVINNGLVQNLKVQLAQSEANMAEIEKKNGVNHPEYQRALAQLTSIREQLDSAVKVATKSVAAAASAARQREGDLRTAVAGQKTRVLEIKKQRDAIALLQRDVENAQHIYDSAMQRSSQSRLEGQSSQTEVAVLNAATPPLKPAKPRTLLNLLVAAFIGGLMGIGLGFLVEIMDRRVRSIEDITAQLGIPVLGLTGKKSGPRRWGILRFRTA
jgi:chain length determinant protein EpsF